jgi:hypothetical protein
MRSPLSSVSGTLPLNSDKPYDGKWPAVLAAVTQYIKKIFTLDLRALGLLRIGMGFLILLDLCIRGSDLEAHYSDSGVLPLGVLFEHNWSRFNLSIHTISGLWQVQLLLFIIAAIFGLMLMFGWRTRLATIVSWFLLLSLQNRNPMILQGGDDLFRMMLFWGMFLPWGERYSVDNLKRGVMHIDHRYCGTAGVAYMLQVGFVYLFSALLKTSPEWHSEGTALYYALSLDQMVLPVGKLIYPYPELLKSLTIITWYLEFWVMFLFFIPIYTTFFRTLGIIFIIGLHLSISLTLFVGLFFIIGIITTFGMLPPKWMDKFERKTAGIRRFFAILITRIRHKVNSLVHVSIQFNFKKRIARQPFVVAREFMVMFFLLFVICWNMQNVNIVKDVTSSVNWAGLIFRTDQNWGMFAPGVFKDDGWYILEGTTKENEKIDLNRNGLPVTYQKPESVVSLFSNDRWRKFSENYLFVCNGYLRPYYAGMMMRRWNESHPDNEVVKLEVIYMKEVTAPGYKYVKPSREVLAVQELDPSETLTAEK